MQRHVPGFTTSHAAVNRALADLPAPRMSPLTWRLYTHRFAFSAMFSVLNVGVPLGLTRHDDSRSAVLRFLGSDRPRVHPGDRAMVCHHERALLALLYLRNAAAIAGMRLIGRPAR